MGREYYVTACVGRLRSSKTLAVVHQADKRFREGWRVVTNFGYVNGESVRTAQDVLRLVAEMVASGDMTPVFLGLDECGMLFPSRAWSSWPDEMDLVLQECSKIGGSVEVWYTVPYFDTVDKQLRIHTEHLIACKGAFYKRLSKKGEWPLRKRPRLTLWVHHEVVNGKVLDPSLFGFEVHTWWYHKAVASLYNTYFLISGVAERLLAAAEALDNGVQGRWGEGDSKPPVAVVRAEAPKRVHRAGSSASSI